ncbi:hypothetical protein [Brevundimonas sp. TWP2-3-4b1]|uniref:hypothetical protein n=1 Tax=Brevundimonas sp. TWP2-3-4b1 TaxID=2804580 RepID=UPI003CE768D1
MSDRCGHLTTVNAVTARAGGCEDRLKTGPLGRISVHEAFGNLPTGRRSRVRSRTTADGD